MLPRPSKLHRLAPSHEPRVFIIVSVGSNASLAMPVCLKQRHPRLPCTASQTTSPLFSACGRRKCTVLALVGYLLGRACSPEWLVMAFRPPFFALTPIHCLYCFLSWLVVLSFRGAGFISLPFSLSSAEHVLPQLVAHPVGTRSSPPQNPSSSAAA